MRKAGLQVLNPHAGKREEYLRLPSHGTSRCEAIKQVGVHRTTTQEWESGIRRTVSYRAYPDGRVVDYKRGMTTYVGSSGKKPRTANPSIPALDKQIDDRILSLTKREEIYALKMAWNSIRQIATTMDRSPSNISREILRNCTSSGNYHAYAAHRQSVARRTRPKEAKLSCLGPRRDYVARGLQLS